MDVNSSNSSISGNSSSSVNSLDTLYLDKSSKDNPSGPINFRRICYFVSTYFFFKKAYEGYRNSVEHSQTKEEIGTNTNSKQKVVPLAVMMKTYFHYRYALNKTPRTTLPYIRDVFQEFGFSDPYSNNNSFNNTRQKVQSVASRSFRIQNTQN